MRPRSACDFHVAETNQEGTANVRFQQGGFTYGLSVQLSWPSWKLPESPSSVPLSMNLQCEFSATQHLLTSAIGRQIDLTS